MYKPNFYKQIDEEYKKKSRQFDGISKLNCRQKAKDKSIPRVNSRFLLLNYFKNCFWCGIPVKEYKIPNSINDDQATIDHVVSRFYRKKGDNVLKVLACYRCNQARAIYENRKLTKKHIEKLSLAQITN